MLLIYEVLLSVDIYICKNVTQITKKEIKTLFVTYEGIIKVLYYTRTNSTIL